MKDTTPKASSPLTAEAVWAAIEASGTADAFVRKDFTQSTEDWDCEAPDEDANNLGR